MSLPLFPSFRRQQLVLDFSGLKHNCPEGIYLTLPPDNPSLWSGVLFVRKGPYESAILRFQISFPNKFPDLPPLITFQTDIFHPLIVPLTTYTFSTGVLDAVGTVSASDEQRLPPGAFSLRFGFPHWFGSKPSVADGDNVALAGAENPIKNELKQMRLEVLDGNRNTIVQVLKHIKSAFEDEVVLDNLTLESAGNPSAWHAWRAHKGLTKSELKSKSPNEDESEKPPGSPRHPGAWKWDGVWESRVNEGVELSINEASLFGSTITRSGPASVDPIRFRKLNDEHLEEIRQQLSIT